MCTLVTFSRAFTGQPADGAPTWFGDGGTAASSAAMNQLAQAISSGKITAAQDGSSSEQAASPALPYSGQMHAAQVLGNSRSLPPVGRARASRLATPLERASAALTAAELDMLSIEAKVPSERAGGRRVSIGTSSAKENTPELAESARVDEDHRNAGGAAHASDSSFGVRGSSPSGTSSNGITNGQRLAWKMQTMSESDRLGGSRVRAAGFGKKKPLITPGQHGRTGTVTAWREHSAPAGVRSNGSSRVVRAWGDDDARTR